jgi:2,3-dihydroxybenzoate-AMP ligase
VTSARHTRGRVIDERVVPYPAEAVARYRAAGLWGSRAIGTEFHAIAARHPDRDAVVTAAGRASYRALDERTDRVAAGLFDLGLRPGDPVVFQVNNRIEAVIAWYGVLKAGLVPVCTLAAHRANEIAPISRITGAVAHLVEAGTKFDLVGFAVEQQAGHPTLRHVLTIGATADALGVRIEDLGADIGADVARRVVEDIQAGIDPDDVAVFQLSGGTTGVPKVIPRLHAEYWYNALEYARSWGWDETTRTGHLIPIIHNAGIVCGLHGPHSVGGCLVLTGADLTEALPVLVAERTTDVLLGHGHYRAVAQLAFAELARTLRTVVLSGAKVPPELFGRLEELGVWSGQLFGMGEGFFALTRPGAPREARLTTVGSPMSPLDEFKVLDAGTESEMPDGEVGELCCAGPYTLRGYFDAPEQNRRAFTSDGFYRTGDLVAVRVVDGQRYLSVEGRIKDVINRGGEKVSAEEVELLLVQHPQILASAVVAMPDQQLGERACAYLVARDRAISMASVQEHLDTLGVAKFKWPERLEWLAELPRTTVNKIDKKRLRADIVAKLAAERGAVAR